MLKNKLLQISLFCFLSVGLVCFLTMPNSSVTFETLAEKAFVQQLEGDSLSQHFVLRNPSAYHIDTSDIRLPVYSKQWDNETCMALENTLSLLNSLDSSLIPAEHYFDYEVLVDSLGNELALYAFPYFKEPLSPSNGAQTQLPLLLAEYSFYDAKDVDTYLTLLACIPEYLEGLSQYEREKSAKGLFMSGTAAAKIIEQCDTFSGKTIPLKEHVLYSSFSRKLSALLESSLITQAEYDDYMTRHELLLTNTVFPAYGNLSQTFTDLKDSGVNPNGLFYFSGGREYYQQLLTSAIGTDKSVSEIKDMLHNRFMKDIHSDDIADFSFPFYYDDPLSDMTPSDILEDLKKRMRSDFYITDSSDFSYTVRDVAPSLEAYCSPAFYFTPPIDNISDNVIYINNSSTTNGIDLYTTLAHEGFPGHLYQSVFYLSPAFNQHPLPFRSLLYYGGYTEGYATYVEMASYRYALDCAKESDPDTGAQDYYKALYIDRNLQLCLYSLLDIMIHYDGMTLEDIAPYLRNLGISNAEDIQNLYSYIVEEPGTYLKYYVGYLEILELKEYAKSVWGDNFSEIKFHTFLLKQGPAPFPLIKKAIPDFIVGDGLMPFRRKNGSDYLMLFPVRLFLLHLNYQ